MEYQKLLDNSKKLLPEFRKLDREKAQRLLRKIEERIADNLPVDRIISKLEALLDYSEQRSLAKVIENITVKFPEELPVSARSDELADMIRKNQVIIVCGATGSGKTTQLPKIALAAGRGRDGLIGCTQPRRIAAVSMAARVAEELNCAVGNEVGYKVRFDNSTSDKTAVKFMTDGILLAETLSDKKLYQYDTLIIDEAHERSLNIDFILGYLKNLLKLRPDLKIIISSATLDADNFSKFFNEAPIVTVEGRAYPVEDFFMEPEEDEDLYANILRAAKWITDVDNEGDILVFLPGEREIREAADVLNGQQWNHTDVLPLYARMGISEQRKIFHPASNRRIILATNVAETSITIPRIHYVIDSGQVRLSRFNPGNQVQELKIEQVSQASARQRRGRCGRIAEGICIYLYDKKTLEDSPEFTDPEIRRSSLAGVILQMETLKLPPIEEFPLIDPPQHALVREGYKTLQNIGAMDKRKRLTALGREIAMFPVDPHLAAMVCRGKKEKVCGAMLVISSFLSIMDPRERPQEKQQAADQAHQQWHDERSDFMTIINLWNFIKTEATSQSKLRKVCKKNFLNFRRVREWQNLFNDLLDVVKNLSWNINVPRNRILEDLHYDAVHRSLLAGIPTHIAKYDPENKYYRGAKNRKFYIFPGSVLFKQSPEWIISFELVSTSRLYARKVAVMEPGWIEDIAPHLCKSTYDNVHWSMERGFVYARETVISSGMVIHGGRTVHYGKVCPEEARKVFIREGMVSGNMKTRGKWLDIHKRMLTKISLYETKLRRPGYMLDEEAIYEHFDNVLPPEVFSVKSLEQWLKKSRARIAMRLNDTIFDHVQLPEPEDFPDRIEFCSHSFKIQYKFAPGEIDDGAMLVCPEDMLNLLPESCPDWGVPGFRTEKIKLLIRSLPKAQRVLFSPANNVADKFCAEVNNGTTSIDQPFLFALAEFLSEMCGQRIRTNDFNTERIPTHLTMKIAETDKSGSITRITEGMPERSGAGSQLSNRLKSAKKWHITGLTGWPDGEIPQSIILEEYDNTTGYPALIDEGKSVGRQVFLDQREAERAHEKGLVKLYKINNSDHMKYLKRNLPLSDSVKLSLCLSDRKISFLEDYLDVSTLAALTDDGNLEIRDYDTFSQREDDTRGRLLREYLVYYADLLDNIVIDKDKVESDLNKVKDKALFFHCCQDVKQQMDFLFRKEFLKGQEVFNRYPRYLKALRIRVERMLLNPAKDESKMEAVEYFQERFRIAYESVDNYDTAFDLQDFCLLLQEFRISQFAPEVRTLVKISSKKLLKAWDDVKL